MTSKAVVLLSGGLDSTTVGAVARSTGADLYALTIDYNQRHRVELDAAQRVAKWLGVRQHVVLPIDLRVFGGSSLTAELTVPKDVEMETIGKNIPNTYVPARNTVFLSLALAYAESVAAQEIYIGISSVDYSGYPDCRPEFLSAFETLANRATRAGVEQPGYFTIKAPLLYLTKKEVIVLGRSLGVDYSLTRTCYDPDENGRSCGRCESCLLRIKGFQEVGIPDPIPY